MKTRKFDLNDGDGISIPTPCEFYITCCDCGLVHHIKVEKESKKSFLMFFNRDNRRTGQRRRYLKN